jgi:hypothetical protein
MKIATGLTIKWKEHDVDKSQEFQSLYSCARFYQLCVPTLHKIVGGGKTRKRGNLPEECSFEIHEPHKSSSEKWHCEICQLEMNKGSKALHLLSIKHREKLVHL